jgi:xanthine/uracil permease
VGSPKSESQNPIIKLVFEMNPTAIILALITFLSTLLGGFIILKFKKSLSIIFAFAAGSIITAVFAGEFIYVGAASLLPESQEHSILKIAVAATLGFLFIFIITTFIQRRLFRSIGVRRCNNTFALTSWFLWRDLYV